MKATRLTVLHVFLLAALVLSCEPSDIPIACEVMITPDVASRASPYDSALIRIGDTAAKVCYGRPSVNGREIFGGLLAFDTLWRMGANEPTIIHLPVEAEIAGLAVKPGKYSLYAVPSAAQWQVIVNASTTQWGITQREVGTEGNVFESQYTDGVRAQEIGRAPVETRMIEPVEQLLMRDSVTADGTDLLVEWSTTQIVIPIRVTEPAGN